MIPPVAQIEDAVERGRHKLFEPFTALVDDEQAVEEMLSYSPARTTQTWVVSTGLSLAGLILAIARFG